MTEPARLATGLSLAQLREAAAAAAVAAAKANPFAALRPDIPARCAANAKDRIVASWVKTR